MFTITNIATTITLYIYLLYIVSQRILGGNYYCTWHKYFFFLLTLLDYFYHAWSKDLRSWSSKNKPEVFLFKMWLAVKRTDANAMWSLDVPILYGGNVQVNKTISHAWVSRQNVVLTYSRELASRLPFFVTIPLYTIVALWRICDFLYVAQLLSVIHRILLVYSERPLSVIVS